MMENELKPCECDGEGIVWTNEVRCKTCGLVIRHHSTDKAIAAWNARAGGESPDAKKLIDAYNMARMFRDKSAEDRALEALTDAINRGGGTPDPYMEVVKRYADKQSLTGLQSSWSQTGRTYEGKDYRVIVAEYGKDPVTQLQNAPAIDAGEVERLVDAASRVVKSARHTNSLATEWAVPCEAIEVLEAALAAVRKGGDHE